MGKWGREVFWIEVGTAASPGFTVAQLQDWYRLVSVKENNRVDGRRTDIKAA